MEQELLIVLDNFEQLLDATGLLVEILQNTQHLKFLVTSRERLKVQSEWVIPIEGLSFPPLATTEPMEQYAAVNLFVQTAQRVRAHFALNEAEEPAVVRICQLVEGMPLAIELAASWISVLSCDDIVHELEKDLGILATSRRDLLERHRNIRSVFDHSWKLLSDAERSALQRLSVFRGGFTRAAAEQVAGASLSVLASLVDKSLLSFNWQPDGAYRYNLHELIRQYAYERLLEEGEIEVERTRERHLETFLDLAERAEPELNGPHNLLWLDLLERELDNLRVAFSWAREWERANRGEKLQRIVGALWWFWCMRGHMEEACTWAECALSQDTVDNAARAKVTWVAGFLHLYHGNQQPARELLEQGVELCRRIGNADKKDLALALNFLGVETHIRGDLAASQAYHEESLAIRRELDDSWGIAQSLMNLGGIADTRGDFITAQSLLEEGLAVSRAWGERSHIVSLLNSLGWTIINQGDFDRARLLFHESLEVCLETRWQWKAAGVFESLARIEARQTETHRLIKAARLWGVAEMLFRVWGSLYHLEDSQAEITTVRDNLGESAFELAWAEGGRMTFDQALAYGLEA
jgi:predicted ATPase